MNPLSASMTVLACMTMGWSGAALAQTWPVKPLTVVVGSPAGSAPDAYARTVAEHMSRTLGQAVIVENRAGAGANIAAELVAKSKPDGYTILVGTQGLMEVNPAAYDNLRWRLTDFAPLIKGVEAPLVLAVHESVPANKVAELAAWAKGNPGKASYASYGGGTPSHFLGHQLAERLKLDLTHVPFPGSGPQTQNLLAGHVPFGFAQIQLALPHIQSGKLRALATTGATRWRQLPNVPTLAELGYKDMTATIWFGLLARAGTPAPVLDQLVHAAQKAHADPGITEKLERAGFDVSGQTEPAFSAAIRVGAERWAKVVKAAGFRGAD